MKITITQTTHVPGQPQFVSGQDYEVTESLGSLLIERQQAVAKVEAKKESKPKEDPKTNTV